MPYPRAYRLTQTTTAAGQVERRSIHPLVEPRSLKRPPWDWSCPRPYPPYAYMGTRMHRPTPVPTKWSRRTGRSHTQPLRSYRQLLRTNWSFMLQDIYHHHRWDKDERITLHLPMISSKQQAHSSADAIASLISSWTSPCFVKRSFRRRANWPRAQKRPM